MIPFTDEVYADIEGEVLTSRDPDDLALYEMKLAREISKLHYDIALLSEESQRYTREENEEKHESRAKLNIVRTLAQICTSRREQVGKSNQEFNYYFRTTALRLLDPKVYQMIQDEAAISIRAKRRDG